MALSSRWRLVIVDFAEPEGASRWCSAVERGAVELCRMDAQRPTDVGRPWWDGSCEPEKRKKVTPITDAAVLPLYS